MNSTKRNLLLSTAAMFLMAASNSPKKRNPVMNNSNAGNHASFTYDFLYKEITADMSFSRAAGTSSYFDVNGTFHTLTDTTTPRFTYDGILNNYTMGSAVEFRGLILEEAGTNYDRNSNFTGAVIGSPGTLPTHMEILDKGTLVVAVEDFSNHLGLPYITLRITGTASTEAMYIVFDDAATLLPADGTTSGCSSSYLGITADSTETWPDFLDGFYFVGGTKDKTHVGAMDVVSTQLLPTSGFVRTGGGGITNDDATRLKHSIALSLTIGETYNLGLRLAGPQFERTQYATSLIPTNGSAAVSRGKESFSAVLPSFFSTSGGSFMLEGELVNCDFTNDLPILSFAGSNPANDFIKFYQDWTGLTGKVGIHIKKDGADVVNSLLDISTGAAPSPGERCKWINTWTANLLTMHEFFKDGRASVSSIAHSGDIAFTEALPTSLASVVFIDTSYGSVIMKKLQYWTYPLSLGDVTKLFK